MLEPGQWVRPSRCSQGHCGALQGQTGENGFMWDALLVTFLIQGQIPGKNQLKGEEVCFGSPLEGMQDHGREGMAAHGRCLLTEAKRKQVTVQWTAKRRHKAGPDYQA